MLEEARERGDVEHIGVCNYNVEQLETLLENARERGYAPPDVVQNELHPAINTPVLALCKRHGIVFEAHSTMLANQLVAPMAEQAVAPLTPAALALLHCKARGADALCITTTKYEHLLEDLAAAATPHAAQTLNALRAAQGTGERRGRGRGCM